MAAYDKVAVNYSEVFADINLRRFEWPWLKKLILQLKPQSLLDLGCGNGYLLEALSPIVPNLYGAEPCVPMFEIAKKRMEKTESKTILYDSPAENLPFRNEEFDAVVSLLSFRYMEWEPSLSGIRRILKPDGSLIIIDLFSASFSILKLGSYFNTFLKTRIQYAYNREYRKKLIELSRNGDWRNMVKQFPKRGLDDARNAVEKEFIIIKEKTLCHSARGKITGLVCRKK